MKIYLVLLFIFIASSLHACVIVVFGATGDLAMRKLLPALYHLVHEHQLPAPIAVVGFSRGQNSHERFRQQVREALGSNIDPQFWPQFKQRLFYHQADFDHDQGYEELQTLLATLDVQQNRIYYLATPQAYFSKIIQKLHQHHFIYDTADPGEKWSRVIIEKPFGDDLPSAIQLHEEISKYLGESQIYLMDHYLGKEGFQNFFTWRFESGLLEPIWNRDYIEQVQITLSESIGIGSRGHFWEKTGFLRDAFQNHLMQLLALVAMEPPLTLSAPHIHAERMNVFNAIRPFSSDQLVRGQYGPGKVQGMDVPGYQEENGVSAASSIETFVTAKLFIDAPRWKGVPFYIRGGKRLPKQTTEIAILFKNGLNALFVRIQPNAGIFFRTISKIPGLDKQTEPIVFGYCPDHYFKTRSPDAHEKLLYDCVRGDQSLYVKVDEQLALWRLLTPVLKDWNMQSSAKTPVYEAGSWGPATADELLKAEGHRWETLP